MYLLNWFLFFLILFIIKGIYPIILEKRNKALNISRLFIKKIKYGLQVIILKNKGRNKIIPTFVF